MKHSFKVIAHRGASAYRPENTEAAFELALALGTKHFETDVRLTRDGVPVLLHDDDLTRYGYPGVTVEGITLDEFHELDLGSWFMPNAEPGFSLHGLLQQFGGRAFFHLEIKGQTKGIERCTYDAVKKAGLLSSVVFTSFYRTSLERLLDIDGTARVGWLMQEIPSVESIRDYGFHQLCPKAELVTDSTVPYLKRYCSEVRCWGISLDDRAQAERDLARVYSMQCDGVTCNWPELRPRMSGEVNLGLVRHRAAAEQSAA